MSEELDSRLLNAIMRTQRGAVIAEQGILPEMFESDARPVFNMIQNHYRQYQKLPSKSEILKHYRGFHFKQITEPLEYYVAEVVRRFKFSQFRNTVEEALAEVSKSDDLNIDEVLNTVTSKFTLALRCGVTSAVDYMDRVDHIAAELLRKKNCPAEFSFGFDALDKDLIGYDRGNLVLIGGLSGKGKSWLMLKMAYENWLKGKKILVVSMEMSSSIIQDRLDAIMCQFDYDRYRRSKLTDEEESRLITNLQNMKNRNTSFKVISFENYDSKAKSALGSVESFHACVNRYKPDMLYVDGIYLGMSMRWEDATKFANDFHTMLENAKVPCTATTQMKQESDEKKPRLQDLAFTAGFQHAASYVFLMGEDGDQLTLVVAKARESMDHEKYLLDFKPATKIDLIPMAIDQDARRDWWEEEGLSEEEQEAIANEIYEGCD